MANERLVFDIFAIDNASRGFLTAAKSASAATDAVKGLGRRLDEIGTKSAEARVGLKGNKDALAQLDQLQFRLLRLGERTSKPNVSLEGFARTSAEISALELQLDRLNEKSRGGSLLQRLLGTGPGGGGALGQLFPGGAAAGTGPGIGLGLGIAAAVPAVEALLVEVTGLITGLAAATAGIGAFGLLALPTFKAVTTAYGNITKAQQAYTAAQELEKADPTAAHAKAAELALDKLKIAQDSLPPGIKTIVTGVQGLIAQFDRMAKVLQPDILKVFNEGLKIATELLPVLLPLAQAAAPAIEGLLKQLGKFFALTTTTTTWERTATGIKKITEVNPTPFGQFVKTITSLAGPAITAIGEGIGRAAVALGKLLTVMSKKDVVHSINILFDAMVIAIDVVIIIIKRLMNNWDSLSNAFRTARHDIAHWLDLTRADIKDFRQWVYDDFILKMVRFFTSTLPTAFDIFKESVRIEFDRVKILALDVVFGITGAFGHLPGPLGAPFRAAHKDIGKELGKIQADVAAASANIQADWDRLHGKTVTVQFDLSTGVTPPGAPHAAARGVSGAAPGWWWVGEQGPELAYFKGGETVIPHGQSMRIAGGYAGGTGFNFRDAFRPSVSRFGPQLTSAFTAVENQVIAANRAAMLRKLVAALPPTPGIGRGVTRWAGLVSQVLGMLEPGHVLPGDLGIVLSQMTTESGGNPAAVNLWDSNARAGHPSVGLMQVIAGTYAANAAPLFGYPPPVAWGVSENPLANIYAGLHYAMSVYGPGWRNVLGHGHGYDSGGQLLPGVTLAVNRTGRAESVLGSRAEGLLEQLVGLVDELCSLQAQANGIAASAPARTGAALSAGSAAYGVLYP